jgi:membrane protease YdiL (CAAX protease family)
VNAVRRHPVVTMFVLVYALTWVVWLPRAGGEDLGLLARGWTWAPAVAALAAAALTGGKRSVREWAVRLVRWRVRWYWYVIVILGPAAFSLLVASCYALIGGSFTEALPWLKAPVVLLPLFLIILTVTDGYGEEPAWRGFALPRLLERHGTFLASLIVGILWALWHLPLLWTAGIDAQQLPWWLLILDVPAKSLFFTLVFQRTNGSVLIAAIFHGATNLFTVSPAFWTSEDWTLPVLATAAKWVLLLVIWLAARWHGHVLSSSKRPRSARAIKAR